MDNQNNNISNTPNVQLTKQDFQAQNEANVQLTIQDPQTQNEANVQLTKQYSQTQNEDNQQKDKGALEEGKDDEQQKIKQQLLLKDILSELKSVSENQQFISSKQLYSNSQQINILQVGLENLSNKFEKTIQYSLQQLYESQKQTDILQLLLEESRNKIPVNKVLMQNQNVQYLKPEIQQINQPQIKVEKNITSPKSINFLLLFHFQKYFQKVKQNYQFIVWPNEFVHAFLEYISELFNKTFKNEQKKVYECLKNVREPETYFPTLQEYSGQSINILLMNLISDARNFTIMSQTQTIIKDILDQQQVYGVQINISLIMLNGPNSTTPDKPDMILQENFFTCPFNFRKNALNKIKVSVEGKLQTQIIQFISKFVDSKN